MTKTSPNWPAGSSSTKRHRALFHSGRVLRIDTPDDTAWMHGVVAADRSAALLSYVQLGLRAARAMAEPVPGQARPTEPALCVLRQQGARPGRRQQRRDIVWLEPGGGDRADPDGRQGARPREKDQPGAVGRRVSHQRGRAQYLVRIMWSASSRTSPGASSADRKAYRGRPGNRAGRDRRDLPARGREHSSPPVTAVQRQIASYGHAEFSMPPRA